MLSDDLSTRLADDFAGCHVAAVAKALLSRAGLGVSWLGDVLSV